MYGLLKRVLERLAGKTKQEPPIELEMIRRVCAYCGQDYEREAGDWNCFCQDCHQTGLTDLPTDRYIVALKRLRGLIENGLELRYFDCVAIGAKDNQCTWGFCNTTKELWPDKQDHKWPYRFETEGRIAPLSRSKGHLCPLDRARNMPDADEHYAWGCFYRCDVFQSPKADLPKAEDVIANLDAILERFSKEE